MFNIKKQIARLYASTLFSNLSLAGAWVAILASRGFSLAQIGFAETVFHIVSLCFEIPSGALADSLGRKKTLIISALMRIIGNAIMIVSNNFVLVCLSIAFNALHWNFTSGSDDALAYDSLKSVGEEEKFEKYSANQLLIFRICEGLSTLTAGFALILGYKISYASGIAFALLQLLILVQLVEIRLEDESKKESVNLLSRLKDCFRESFAFLKKEKRTVLLMLANSLVGALDVLLLFFLQAKLPMTNLPEWALGIALLVMQLGGIAGTRLVGTFKSFGYKVHFAFDLCALITAIFLEHTAIYALMILGGFVATCADDALQVRTNALLQQRFPSEQRATLASIESFTFSIVMIVLSPLAGLFFTLF